ncbi:MAG: radical SAM protein, partial [Parasporobacterium sp.]|nr:radical SAM protein [Parasporobacterium sp.]
SCIHCGSRCEPSCSEMIDTQLLFHALDTVAEDFDHNSLMICLTGGEPMLHPDFFRIAEYINRLGFSWGMTTNGSLITRANALALKKAGLGSITVSLDGLKASHEWFRNTRGSFDKTVDAIQNLHYEGISVQVTTVIHKKNYNELEELYGLMKSLKVESWRVINIEPIGRAQEHEDLTLSAEEFRGLLNYIREKRFSAGPDMDVCFGCSHYLSFEHEHEVRDNYFLCGAGICVASILKNGDIYSCLDIERRPELVQGNIRDDRFSEVWFNRFEPFRKERSLMSEECRKCPERLFCRGDSAHTWDYDNNKPLFCIRK